jgi:hypothetical protein
MSIAIPLLRTAWFDRFRGPRVLATAAAAPIVLFIAKGIFV